MFTGQTHPAELGSRSNDRTCSKNEGGREVKEERGGRHLKLTCLVCTHSSVMEMFSNGTLFVRPKVMLLAKGAWGEGKNMLEGVRGICQQLFGELVPDCYRY